MEERQNESVRMLIHGLAEDQYAQTEQQKQWERRSDNAMKLAKWTGGICAAAIVIALGTQSMPAAMIVLLMILSMGFGFYAVKYDMENSYLAIEGDAVRIVTYPCRIRRERVVLLSQIVRAESLRVQGMLPYIVLRGRRNRFLFQIAANRCSMAVFGKYLKAEK